FITELDKSTVSEYAFVSGILSTNNSELKTFAELNERLFSLYGSDIHSSVRKRGDLQIITISSSWIHNRFALENENISAQMLETVKNCIFNPYAENNAFNDEAFRITRKDILDSIITEINDKRSYTINRTARLAYRGEPAELPSHGTLETAQAVTPESAFEAYKKLMQTAQVEIFYVSPEKDDSVADIFAENFAKTGRQPASFPFRSASPVKPAPELVTEKLDVGQAKIAFSLKSDSTDYDALYLMSLILGGTPVSKLFVNVREKLSLCYYCSCRYNEPKNSFIIDCGVEKENIPAATKEIFNQLDEMKNGNISDDEIRSVILALENGYTAVGDTPASYASWYFERFCDGDYITPLEKYKRICSVSKERIVQAARTVSHDCTFHMLGKEVE
ncbi:MAG: insulinase family protein, partial [Ruminococcus sp.]|nr:insulinase family protein [Ruminococcus sp.]